MARKSNKTAHVLNLLAGHDTQNTSEENASGKESASAKDSSARENTPTASGKNSATDARAATAAISTGTDTAADAPSEAGGSKADAAPARSAGSKDHTPSQNISVIDTTGKDPLAELIQQKLSDEFGGHDSQNAAEDGSMPDSSAVTPLAHSSAAEKPAFIEDTPAATADSFSREADAAKTAATETAFTGTVTTDSVPTDSVPADTAPIEAASTETVTKGTAPADTAPPVTASTETASTKSAPDAKDTSSIETSSPATDNPPVTKDGETEDPFAFPQSKADTSAEPISVPGPEPDANAIPVPSPESVPGPGHTAPKPEPVKEPEPEPEPDFVYLNIMEEIVKDKIIYFMRQFDVCTCPRCKADTIALTMNGLLPKYIVTTPAAVDPLVSYYTNRLISDVTVEATKACMTIKDNPRH